MRSLIQYLTYALLSLALTAMQADALQMSQIIGVNEGKGILVRLRRGDSNLGLIGILTQTVVITELSGGNERLIAFENNVVVGVDFAGILSHSSVVAAEWIQTYSKVASHQQRRQSSLNWHLDRINQRSQTLDGDALITPGGAGVRIYVVDSGVDVDHPAFTDGNGGSRAEHLFNAHDDKEGSGDIFNHGTHVAGLAAGHQYGAATQAKISSVKVLDASGSGTTTTVLEGLNRILHAALENPGSEKRIAVLSLAGPMSPMVDAMIAHLYFANVLVVVSAGNDYHGDACYRSPSNSLAAVTVGATARNDQIASFSNVGVCVDILAPGEDVYSSLSGGGYGPMSGTSMSAPLVAGVAAALWSQDIGMSARQVRVKILMDSTSLANPPAYAITTADRLLYSNLKVVAAPSADFKWTGLVGLTPPVISSNDIAVSAGFDADLADTSDKAWDNVRKARRSSLLPDDPLSTRVAQSYYSSDGSKALRVYAGGATAEVLPTGTIASGGLVATLLGPVTKIVDGESVSIVDDMLGTRNFNHAPNMLSLLGLDQTSLFDYNAADVYGIYQGLLPPANDAEFNANRRRRYSR